MFAIFAALQWNDPDPFGWIAVYLAVAAICGFGAFGKYDLRLTAGIFLACFAWAMTMVPGFIEWIKMGMPNIAGQMKAETPYIEVVREFLGLVICMVILSGEFFYFRNRLSNKS